jgi:DNA repair ATPase RecN
VNATIGKISEKINEQKELTQRLHEVAIDLENLRNLASEFVNHAYQNEIEIHATSKVRVQIAESLNQRIKNALKP